MSQARRFEELTLTESEREAFLERMRACSTPEDYRRVEGMSYALPELLSLIEKDQMSLGKLRHALFGPKTEKTDQVCPPAAAVAPATSARPKCKGHGRTKATEYTGARWVPVAHPQLKAGVVCPLCSRGSVRMQKSKSLLLRIVGAPPISATGYAMERLRCDTCGGRNSKVCSQCGSGRGLVALRQRNASLSTGSPAEEPGSSLARIDPVGGDEATVRAGSARL